MMPELLAEVSVMRSQWPGRKSVWPTQAEDPVLLGEEWYLQSLDSEFLIKDQLSVIKVPLGSFSRRDRKCRSRCSPDPQ